MQESLSVNEPKLDPVPALQERFCVLIVDDSRDVVDSLALALELDGFCTCRAYDGETALVSAREIAPKVVILDLLLPDMDGYELAQALRSDSRCRNTLLIAYTGDATDAARARCAAAGIDLYVLKPVDPQELLRVITRHKGKAPEHVPDRKFRSYRTSR